MNVKRFTISVSSDLEEKLDKLKQKEFYNTSRTTMINFLLKQAFSVIESDCINKNACKME